MMPLAKDLESRDRRLGIALLLPAVFLFACLILYPFLNSIWLSLNRINTMTLSATFVGLANYREILSSPEFWQSLMTTFIWTIGSLILQIGLGVAVALMLHQKLWFRSLARGLVLFPYLLPMVVAVLVWKWLFNDLYGIVNHLLMSAGIVNMPIDWLGSIPNAMISTILIGGWKYFPFVVLAVLARLQTIPEQLYEAARVDGASMIARFFDITLPQLRDVLAIVILLRAIWDFKEFDLIYMLTGGGPVASTETLPLLVYKQAFPLMQMGKAAATAILMMAVMSLFMVLYFRMRRRIKDV
jgi:multiple sugar transport system permease protein